MKSGKKPLPRPTSPRPLQGTTVKTSMKYRGRLRGGYVGEGIQTVRSLKEEFHHYWQVLLGREDPPEQHGILTLMEVADAYYARAGEVTAMIQDYEARGLVDRKHPLYKFRNGYLRTFMEVAKYARDLGSRRVTARSLEQEAEKTGRHFEEGI